MVKKNKNIKNKLLVIGLDGATFDIILPLIKTGKLPAFEKLIKEGAYGTLKSSIPPITPVAWETAVTGVNPGQHNIFDFVSYKTNYDIDIVDSKNRAALAVWDYIARFNKKSIVFNYPMGYPPPNINGIFVSGMNTPGVNTAFTTPDKIKKELLKNFPDYKIDVLGDHIVNGREDLFFEDVKNLTKIHFEAALYLLKKYDWDLSLIFFTEPDRVQHYFFHDTDKFHPLNKLKKSKTNRMLEYYILLDNILKDFMNRYPEISFIIFSDHGITALHKDVFIEKYLCEWNLLFLNKTSKGFFHKVKSRFFRYSRKIIYNLGLADKILKIIPGSFFTFIVKTSSIQEEENGNVDWENTKVYFPTPSSQGLRINLRGREIKGTVSNKDYDKIRSLVIKKLLTLRDPENGQKIIKNVYRREDIYSGPYVENAQDLIIETNSKYHLQKGTNKGKFGLASEEGVPKSAEHARDGIFILLNKGLIPRKLKDIQLVDIAAYILYILGIPIPSKIEGKVDNNLFRNDKN